jgi:hypothetical protein
VSAGQTAKVDIALGSIKGQVTGTPLTARRTRRRPSTPASKFFRMRMRETSWVAGPYAWHMRKNLSDGVLGLLRLGHPLQSRQPEIVSAVHERLITLAKPRRILSNPGLVHYDMAHGALRLQIP